MESPVLELERILKEEISIYDRIASLEEEKTDSILSRDGCELESFAREQERLLSEIAGLEEKRERSIDSYRVVNHIDEMGNVTLENLVRNMDEDSALRLSRCGMELKKTVLRMKSLSETNRKLIEDNMEFFDILLSGIKSSATLAAGYTRDGEAPRMVNGSLLINRTV
jgi:flagellar biosynthesis/type III secretory pathway chaperone